MQSLLTKIILRWLLTSDLRSKTKVKLLRRTGIKIGDKVIISLPISTVITDRAILIPTS